MISNCLKMRSTLPQLSKYHFFNIGKAKFSTLRFDTWRRFSTADVPKVDVDKTQLSAVIKEFNKPLIFEEITRNKLKKGQVRIGVHYCGVNASDHLLWTGQTDAKPPILPGFEVSGEVLEICDQPVSGNETDDEEEEPLKVGDRVLALNKELLNGFSTECIADKKDVFQIPSSISYETGAAIADSYGTALLGLSRRAKLQQNEIVLITAAAGGLGLAAVDIAANIYKAKVIGVCGTEDKATLVRDKGAWAAFTFTSDKMLKSEVSSISEGKGAQIIFEAAGGDVFTSAMRCVAPEGKVIVAGFTSRDLPQLPTSEILSLPSFSLIGVSLLNYRNRMFDVYRRTIWDVIEMCDQGLISPTISEVFPLNKVNEAIVSLTEKKTTGKVLIEVNQS